MPEPPEPSIYQLRAVLLGISPIIWRRLLVRGDSTIADLHATLQTAFGWSDDHLRLRVKEVRCDETMNGLQFGLAPPKAVGAGGKEPQDFLPPN